LNPDSIKIARVGREHSIAVGVQFLLVRPEQSKNRLSTYTKVVVDRVDAG